MFMKEATMKSEGGFHESETFPEKFLKGVRRRKLEIFVLNKTQGEMKVIFSCKLKNQQCY